MLRIIKISLLAILFIAIGSLSINAQDVKFTVDAPNSVEHGAQFRISYQSNTEGQFKGPSFSDFQLLGGPSVSSQSSFQMINGRTSRSSTKTYTYYLKATKIGTFKLPIAKLVVGNKVYKSVGIKIKVVKSVNPQNGQTTNISNPDFKPEGRVFIRSVVNKRKVYIGEPIVLTQKLYSKEKIANITDIKEPTLTNFYKENIDIGELKLSSEVINGQSYNVVILRKAIIFPQKNGKLEIGSFDLDLVVQIIKKRRARDRMEQMMYGNIVRYYDNSNLKLKSPKVVINAKALPSNKPAGFNGIVGNFSMTAKIDKTELKTNDAFNLKIIIKGTGNIDLLEAPKINFPPDFEVYDPKVSKNIKKSTSGISGTKTYEYIIIPGNEGEYTIPSFGFSYFNPDVEHYESCKSKDFKIKVNPGNGVIANNSGVAVNRDEIKYVGKDIRHISFNTSEMTPIGAHKFNSIGHILFLSLSPLFALLIIVFIKNREAKRGNISLMRLKKATKMAKKRMKIAQKAMNSNNEGLFYEETSQALWGYLADKFNIDLSELSMDSIATRLQEQNVDNEHITEIRTIIENCEYARYAPSKTGNKMSVLYSKAIDVISKIEKSLNK